MSLIVVGSVAFDSVEAPHGSIEDALGGSATYFSIAASYFTPVYLVAVVGEDFTDENRSIFNGRNIDVVGLKTVAGRTFRWKGKYSDDMNERITLDTQLNVFEHFEPQIPESYKKCRYVFLANIDPELQMKVLQQIPEPHLTACDTMNFWIESKPEALKKTLSMVDLLIINDEEVKMLSGKTNIYAAGRELLEWGPKTLIVKKGEHGAIMMRKDGVFVSPAFPQEKVMDTTGAGDSFAGGFMGWIAGKACCDDDVLRQAMVCGAVMASFNVESFSLDRLASLSEDEIVERCAYMQKMIHFQPLDF